MEQTAEQNIGMPKRTSTPAGSHDDERRIENIINIAGDDCNARSASRISDILCMCSSIGLGTLLGLLSRTGVIIVSNELLKTELTGIVWSNFVACFCMGLFVNTFSILGLPKDHNVYLGLTTGYCGTFSSFSSAALEIFNAGTGRNPQNVSSPSLNSTDSSYYSTPILIAKSISDFAGSTFVHIGVSSIGYHVGDSTAPLILQDRGPAFLQWSRDNSLCLKISSISLSIMVITSSLLETFFIRTFNFFIYISFALAFALPGTSLRYLLSKELNYDKRKNRKRIFPLGTFTANALGSLVLATTTLLTLGIKSKYSTMNKTDSLIITDELPCCILSAIGHGFCGALTTMSTFIDELTGMKHKMHIYIYGVSSVLITVGSFMIVWGTYSWSVGYVIKSTCL